MRDEGVVLLGKPIDNSRVVRQVDPRSRREIWLLIAARRAARRRARPLRLAGARDAAARGRRASSSTGEKERLLEQKRKLQLEKAALENLRPRRGDRAEGARPASRPRPEQSIVVEVPRAAAEGPDDRARDAAARGARRRRPARPAREPRIARSSTARSPRTAPSRARAPDAPAADAARAHGLAVGAGDRHPPGAAAGARPRVLRAAGRAPERAHGQPGPAPRADPRPRRPAARGLGRRREHLRGAAGHRRPAADGGRRSRARSARRRRRAASCWRSCRRAPPSSGSSARSTRPPRERIRALQLDGIGFVTEHRRYYPQRELAAQVLGYVGLDNAGMAGVEYAARAGDPRPRGEDRRAHRRAPPARRPDRAALDRGRARSCSTLDEAIQHIAERELDRSMAETQAASGTVIVVEPFSGEILALADRPGFNPNRYRAYPSWRWRNRAVVRRVRARQHLQDRHRRRGRCRRRWSTPTRSSTAATGAIEIAGISDQRPRRLRPADASAAVIAKSSDIGMIRVAQRLGRDNFARYVRAFGFGAPTGVELPGESGGPAAPAGEVERAVAGLDVLRPGDRRHGAADDDGRRRGRERRLPDEAARSCAGSRTRGHGAARATSPSRCAACSSPTPSTRSPRSCAASCATGTGQQAAVPGYVVAGKTGTAQKVDAIGPLLDDRPRRLLRGLRARLAPGARRAGLARHAARRRATRAATWRRRSSPAWPRARCACWPCRPTTRPACCAPWRRRRTSLLPAAYRPRRATARPRRAPAGRRARADARPARPLGARGRDRRGAPRPGRRAARLGPGRRAEPGARAPRSSRATPAC